MARLDRATCLSGGPEPRNKAYIPIILRDSGKMYQSTIVAILNSNIIKKLIFDY
jgi:hypothetical protein